MMSLCIMCRAEGARPAPPSSLQKAVCKFPDPGILEKSGSFVSRYVSSGCGWVYRDSRNLWCREMNQINLKLCKLLLQFYWVSAMLYLWPWSITETIHKHGAPWPWLFPITVPPRELVGTPAGETPLTHVKYGAVAQLSWQEKVRSWSALHCPGSFLGHWMLPTFTPPEQTPVLCSSQCSPGCRHQNWTCDSGLNLTKMSNSSRKVLHFCVHAWFYDSVTFVFSWYFSHQSQWSLRRAEGCLVHQINYSTLG